MLSRIIKAYMALNNMNQKEVASSIGMTAPTFCNKINGKLVFSLDEIQRIAELFGIEMKDLFFANQISKLKIVERG